MYREIIRQNWKNGSEEIMNKSIEMVGELLEEVKKTNPDKYWNFIREQQGLMSGGHYDRDFAQYDVSKMYHTTKRGEKKIGEHWSLEQARQVRQEKGLGGNINDYDVYVALNAFWHDTECSIEEEKTIIDAAIAFWFMDEDFPAKNKVWWYFCKKNRQ